MIRLIVLAATLLSFAAPAMAVPVLDVLSGQDGNFSFSVVHSSSGGNDGQSGTILDAISFGSSGSATTVGGLLQLDVELVIGGGTYDAIGAFDLAGLLDLSTQQDILLGTLELSHVSGNNDYDGLEFYFEDRNYSSATLKPNSLQDTYLSLWGATGFNQSLGANPAIGDVLDLEPGGTGIDLRLELGSAPVPEPQAALVFLVGFVTIQLSLRSRAQA